MNFGNGPIPGLNAVKRVERRNMFWHLEKRALMAENNRI